MFGVKIEVKNLKHMALEKNLRQIYMEKLVFLGYKKKHLYIYKRIAAIVARFLPLGPPVRCTYQPPHGLCVEWAATHQS